MRTTALAAVLAGLVLAVPATAQTPASPEALGEASVPQPESADEQFSPSHLALAQEIVDLTQSDTAFDDILPRLAQQTQQLFTRGNPSLTREIEEVVYSVAVDMASRRVELSKTIQLVWARRFSEAELRELRTFFTSAVGKKFVETTPVITALSVGAARQWEQTLSTEMVEETRKQLREKGYAL